MRGRIGPLVGSFVFFWIAPATVAGWIPYLLTGWQVQAPLLGFPAGRGVGLALAAAGLAGVLECFARFAVQGRGTPAPVAPPEILVVTGLYRHVRNPMYVAGLTVIAGQALLLGSVLLLAYAGAVWLAFHTFVLAYEERALRRRFGTSYERYRANVPRWLPRVRPWSDRNA
jgi:protein-S-isoprenylcysteine O-methyltransferase Ste14